MSWISYAQNGEDVVLARVLADVATGFWIDVGAQDPRMDSVTCAFAARGWRGINVEPVARWHAALVEARPDDVNLDVAAGEAAASLPFFEVIDSGLSTLDARLAATHRDAGHEVREQEMRVRTLADICAEHVRGPVHFLKIDAEGAEPAVLRGMDFDAVRPWVVLVEATAPNSRVPTHAEWEPVLLAARYAFAYADGINRFYLALEHAALADRFGPPTVLDDVVRREQVDAIATLEARLGQVEAMSRLRAAELENHALLVAEKDAGLAAWQARVLAESGRTARLQVELADADARARAAEAAHDALSGIASTTAAELDRMHREAAALQRALADADARAAASEAARSTAMARADTAQAALAAAEAGVVAAQSRHEATQAALATAEARIAAADAALVASDARAAARQAELGAAQAHADALRSTITAGDALRMQLQVQLATAHARLAAAEHALSGLAAQVPDLQARVRAATASHAAAHAELLRHVGLIDGMRAEHAVVLASRSWRLTAPLRQANGLFARARAALPRRLGGTQDGQPAAAARLPAAQPLPLSEDAEQVLASAPVVGRAGD